MHLIFQCFISLFALLEPPIAERIPHVISQMDQDRIDNYFWLREEDNPKVIAYLDAENTYTEEMTSHLKPLEETLYEEMKNRTVQNDATVPVKRGNYYYYSRWEEGKSYPLHCRKKGSLDAPEEVYFDENAYATTSYFSLESLDLSPDQNILAYSTDSVGNELPTLKFRDLSHNTVFSEELYPVVSALFANDNKTVFYLVPDGTQRPYRLYRHTLGSDPKEDVLLFEEVDPLFSLSLNKSRDEQYIFLQSKNNTTSVARYLDANTPLGTFAEVYPKKENVKYGVEHHNGQFFLLINDTSINYRVVVLDVGHLDAPPKELIAPRTSASLERMEMFERYLVLGLRENGLPQFEIFDFQTSLREQLPFYEVCYSLYTAENPDYTTTLFRFFYSSLVTPMSVFDYDMQSRKIELKKQEKIHNYDPSNYSQERFFATAADGVKIPISLCYKKNTPRKALLLNGYGAYGFAYPATFSASSLSLLDRGCAIAIAHVRGGGEYGRMWYDEGRMLHKKNTFGDFVACSEHLIAKGEVTANTLVIQGGSAGGLLMGAVTNMRPELFRAVIAKVPFVDVINTMSDPSLPATIGEYQEWGNPAIASEYTYMMSYSPYDNVFAKNYPTMLITAGLNDMRVRYWEPAKWAAKLRAYKTDSNPLLLKTHMKAGHFGSSGRYDSLKEQAFIYSYLLSLFK